MKIINIDYINKYDENDYVWYACYGSNINTDRLMIYINGDKLGKLGSKKGCRNKEKPKEERPYIFNYPIYFAKQSKKWNGGAAFLDYKNKGLSYGKIYKLKMSQFKDILAQEFSTKLYDTVIYVDDCDKIPIFTFTTANKPKILNKPSKKYKDIIKKGIQNTYKNLNEKAIEKYFEN